MLGQQGSRDLPFCDRYTRATSLPNFVLESLIKRYFTGPWRDVGSVRWDVRGQVHTQDSRPVELVGIWCFGVRGLKDCEHSVGLLLAACLHSNRPVLLRSSAFISSSQRLTLTSVQIHTQSNLLCAETFTEPAQDRLSYLLMGTGR